MNNQSVKLTKEDLQKQVGLPTVYKEAIEHAIYETTLPDECEEALCSDYFRAEVLTAESDNELRNGDKLKEDEYYIESIWFQAGWKARQRCEQRPEVQSENIAKTISKATRR